MVTVKKTKEPAYELVVGVETGGVIQVEEGGYGRSKEIRVEDSRAVAEPGKGEGQVGGDGGLAHAALGRGDGDDVGDAADRALGGEAALEAGDGAFLGEAL